MEQLAIQSDMNNIIEVERFVSVMCDTYNIHNYAATISMSLLQAVENAIIHGNKSDSSKMVVIECDRCRGGVYFSVTDQGQGFDYCSYGKMPEHDDKGMGLYLMKSLSDKIIFSDNGRKVRMEYVVNGIDASHALERIVTLRNYYSQHAVVHA